MTQRQLDRAVAAATGESLATIHRLGFVAPADLEPEDLPLAVDCPFCRRPVTYPGLAGGGAAALAECDRCDVYFDFCPARSTPRVPSSTSRVATPPEADGPVRGQAWRYTGLDATPGTHPPGTSCLQPLRDDPPERRGVITQYSATRGLGPAGTSSLHPLQTTRRRFPLITLTRLQARGLRGVFRRHTLGITGKGPAPPLVLDRLP